jgi:hypothetical protein
LICDVLPTVVTPGDPTVGGTVPPGIIETVPVAETNTAVELIAFALATVHGPEQKKIIGTTFAGGIALFTAVTCPRSSNLIVTG